MARLAELWATCVDGYDTRLCRPPRLPGSRAPLARREGGLPVPARPLRGHAGAHRGLLRTAVTGRAGCAEHPGRAARPSKAPGSVGRCSFLRGGCRPSVPAARRRRSIPACRTCCWTARALGLGATLTTWHLMIEADFKRRCSASRGVHAFGVIPEKAGRSARSALSGGGPVAEVLHSTTPGVGAPVAGPPQPRH